MIASLPVPATSDQVLKVACSWGYKSRLPVGHGIFTCPVTIACLRLASVRAHDRHYASQGATSVDALPCLQLRGVPAGRHLIRDVSGPCWRVSRIFANKM